MVTVGVRRALVLAIVTALPLSAGADRGDWTLSAGPAYAVTYVDARSPSGGGGSLEVGFGLTESLTLKAAGFVGWHPVTAARPEATAGTLGAFSATLGLNYALEVIRLVPSFDLVLGLFGLRGAATFADDASSSRVVPAATALAIGLGFGLDYLLTRQIALGVVVRYHALVTELNRVPIYLWVGPRVTIRWGD